MKKIMLLLLVSAILTGIAAAQGYEIKVKIHHIPNDTVILGHHFNERLIPDDTVVLDTNARAYSVAKKNCQSECTSCSCRATIILTSSLTAIRNSQSKTTPPNFSKT